MKKLLTATLSYYMAARIPSRCFRIMFGFKEASSTILFSKNIRHTV
jgi:hypothetical protein